MNADALLALQQIDSALDRNRNRRTRLPELAERNTAAATVRALHTDRTRATTRAAEAQTVIDATEHAAASIDARRTRLEAQLKTVIAPREAEALMHEISTLGQQRDELDERELEALGEQEEADGEAAAIDGRLPDIEAVRAEAQAALDAALAELDSEQAALLVSRDAAAATLSAEELAAYERAKIQFAGVAVAHLDGTRCSGCHLDIARADIDRLRALPAGEPGECPQCGRFLVR